MTLPPLPELRTAAQAAHIALTCISTHPTLDMSDYLRGRVDAAAAGLEAALAAVPAQPVATSARGLLAAWQAAANVLFVSRSSGQYTTDTVSRNDLIQLIEAAFAAAPQAVPTDKDSLMVAQAVPVPAGWVMVPVEPTAAMNQAADNVKLGDRESGEITLSWDEYEAIYRAMLAAAPKEQPHE